MNSTASMKPFLVSEWSLVKVTVAVLPDVAKVGRDGDVEWSPQNWPMTLLGDASDPS